MEYTIGSIADLISGKNTPNKPKIVKKQIQKSSPNKRKAEPTEAVVAKKVKKEKKKKAIETSDTAPSPVVANGIKRVKKKKVKSVDPSNSNNKIANVDKKQKKMKVEPEDQINVSTDQSDTISPKKKKHSAERRIEKKVKEERLEDPEIAARTIFVGNVPIGTLKKKLKKLFSTYGTIETIRFRGIPVANPNVPKKVAAIKQEFHPNRKSCISYIKFSQPEEAENAQTLDGSMFNEHHLRVQLCSIRKSKQDETKAIFVGNLPFDAEEEELWKLFDDCGPIASIRIIRDMRTGMGKGFAYINFKDADAVQLALEMENVKMKNRELRISLSDLTGAKRKKKMKKLNNKKPGQQKKPKPNKLSLEKKRKVKKIAPHDK